MLNVEFVQWDKQALVPVHYVFILDVYEMCFSPTIFILMFYYHLQHFLQLNELDVLGVCEDFYLAEKNLMCTVVLVIDIANYYVMLL